MSDRESLLGRIKEGFHDMLYIWWYEMKQVFKDEGVLIFFILVPLLYPLLYSWAYNNEVVQDVPVVAVDNSRSSLSRDFLRRCDGTQGIKIVAYAADMEEAKEVMRQQGARGIIFIPSDFSEKLNRMASVSKMTVAASLAWQFVSMAPPSHIMKKPFGLSRSSMPFLTKSVRRRPSWLSM